MARKLAVLLHRLWVSGKGVVAIGCQCNCSSPQIITDEGHPS